MKFRYIAAALALALVVAAGFSGCDFFSITIDGRISQFQEDINSSDRSSVYLNFHPDYTTDYDAMKISSYWDTWFQTGGTYTISGIDSSDSSAVTATINGPAPWTGGVPAKFVMAKSGMNWMIEEIYQWNGSSWDIVVD